MKLPGKKWIISGAALIVAGLVCLLIAHSLSRPLTDQCQAERWAGESTEEYAQYSGFFAAIPEEEMWPAGLRQKLDENLIKANLDAPAGGRRFCDAWSAGGTVRVSGPNGSFDASAEAVGGSFFAFHPATLLSGSYLAEDDLMKDRVVLDERLAWMLYGASDLVGLTVMIGGDTYVIAGVVESPGGVYAAVRNDTPLLYLPWESRGAAELSGGACYEIVLPDPVKGFADGVLEEVLPKGTVTVRNSDRFSFASTRKQGLHLAFLSVSDSAVAFPFWENAARVTETRCAVLRLIGSLLFLLPAAVVCVVAARAVLFARGKAREAVARRKMNY